MKTILKLAAAIIIVFTGFSGATAQDKTKVYFMENGRGIELQTQSTKPLPRDFIRLYAKQPGTYKLYEVETPDPEKMCVYERCIKEWRDFLDPSHPPECKDQDCQSILLYFSKQLLQKNSFILVVDKFQSNGKAAQIPFKLELVAEIIGPSDIYQQGKEFRVSAPFPIQSAREIEATREVVRLKSEPPNELKAVEVKEEVKASLTKESPSNDGKILSYKLHKKLLEGNTYKLSISSGITDAAGRSVEAKGSLKIPGQSGEAGTSKISGSLVLSSAVASKAVFDLTGKFSPPPVPCTGSWFWEPSLTVDVGFRSTKSNNSISLGLPLTKYFEVSRPEIVGEERSNISSYAGWRKTPWNRLANIKYYIGPKAEFDRKFKRINALGNMRFDFNFYRLQGSIKNRRDLISQPAPQGIGEEGGKQLEGINFGLQVVPYLSLDFGGHVNNEILNKGNTSVLVPRHGIFRSYAGFLGTIEWRMFSLPLTLTLDESMVYMATREQIGYTTTDRALLRRIHGFQPHLKTSLDLGLDPNKHYSLNFSYENGRLAPNFEYLNKLSSGIKVTY